MSIGFHEVRGGTQGPPEPGPLAGDLRLLFSVLTPAWTVLALGGLLAGVLWRTVGSPPPLLGLLGALGVALWAGGWWLAGGAEKLLARQYRHVQAQRNGAELLAYAALALLLASVLLALAPVAVLLAYQPSAEIQFVVTLDPASFNVLLAPFTLLALLGGAPLALISGALLLLARRLLGTRHGTLAWLALSLYANAGVLAGVAGRAQSRWLPPSLGQMAEGALSRMAHAASDYAYLRSVVTAIMALPIALVLTGMALSALGLWLRRGRERDYAPHALALAAWTSIAAVAIRAAGQFWLYAGDPAYRFPGDWRELPLLGTGALWLVLWLATVFGAGMPRGGELAAGHWRAQSWWLLAVPAAWVLCTVPAIRADQVGQPEVFRYYALWLGPLLLGVILVALAQRLSARLPVVAALIPLALLAGLIPPGGGHGPWLAQWMNWFAAHASPAQLWGGWMLLIAPAVALFARPAPRWKKASRQQPEPAA